MKRIFLLVVSLFFVFIASAVEIITSSVPLPQDPLLVVVIMVKDEEAVIRQTLDVYCKIDPKGAFISYFVYDTGTQSWSPTMAKARELFEQYQVPYVIAQEPFEDFSSSRNKALRYTEKIFPQATFMLMIDAEWYLNDARALLQFCLERAVDEHISKFLVRVLSQGLDFYIPRLIRAHQDVCFEGVVHEVVRDDGKGADTLPSHIYFEYPQNPVGLEKTQRRWHRDCELLLNEHIKHPEDPRTVFYLAQTYDCLNDNKNAYQYYVKRTQMSGFCEEDYMAHYRLGVLSERMISPTLDWTEVLRHYLNAFMVRPTRIEPLVRIAVHYINLNLYDLAFLYAYIACQAPYPTDVLFVEKELYDRVRYEAFAKAGLQVGLEIPERVCREALNRKQQQLPLERFILSQALGL